MCVCGYLRSAHSGGMRCPPRPGEGDQFYRTFRSCVIREGQFVPPETGRALPLPNLKPPTPQEKSVAAWLASLDPDAAVREQLLKEGLGPFLERLRSFFSVRSELRCRDLTDQLDKAIAALNTGVRSLAEEGHCPECGTEIIPDSAKFINTNPAKCPECQATVPQGLVHCAKCDKKICFQCADRKHYHPTGES